MTEESYVEGVMCAIAWIVLALLCCIVGAAWLGLWMLLICPGIPMFIALLFWHGANDVTREAVTRHMYPYWEENESEETEEEDESPRKPTKREGNGKPTNPISKMKLPANTQQYYPIKNSRRQNEEH